MIDEEPVIKGWRIDLKLFMQYSLRRCGLGECGGMCCAVGAWVDRAHAARIHEHADQIKPYLPAARRDESTWFDDEELEDVIYPPGDYRGTAVYADPNHPTGQSCVFLREDFKCALQMAGAENGEGRWGYKPFFCALYPLRTQPQHRLALDDDNDEYRAGGSCARMRVPREHVPLYQILEDEIKLVLGEEGFQELAALAAGEE